MTFFHKLFFSSGIRNLNHMLSGLIDVLVESTLYRGRGLGGD